MDFSARRFKTTPEIILKPYLSQTDEGYTIMFMSEDLKFEVSLLRTESDVFAADISYSKDQLEKWLSEMLRKELEANGKI